MSSPSNNGYDEALLGSVKVDKRAIQEGYSTDLLNDKPARSPAPTPPPQRGDTSDSVHRPLHADPEAQSPLKPRKVPFYRSKKGLIALGALLVVIIVAAVVGGVVGSRNNKKGNVGLSAPADGGQDNGQQAPAPEQGDQAAPQPSDFQSAVSNIQTSTNAPAPQQSPGSPAPVTPDTPAQGGGVPPPLDAPPPVPGIDTIEAFSDALVFVD